MTDYDNGGIKPISGAGYTSNSSDYKNRPIVPVKPKKKLEQPAPQGETFHEILMRMIGKKDKSGEQ